MSQKKCKIPTCDRLVKALGYCKPHYQRVYRYGDVQEDVPIGGHPNPIPPTCTRDDCDKPHYAKGLCNSHYQRKWQLKNIEAIRAYQRDWKRNQKKRRLAERLQRLGFTRTEKEDGGA